MVNVDLLRKKMSEMRMTKADVAAKMGLSTRTLTRRFKDPDGLLVSEVRKLSEILDLSAREVDDIFFAK